MANADTVGVLKLSVHGATVGFLAGYQDGRTTLTFTPQFASHAARPTFSLITHPTFPKATDILANPWLKRQKLHPVLSNLLPERALGDWIIKTPSTTHQHVPLNEFTAMELAALAQPTRRLSDLEKVFGTRGTRTKLRCIRYDSSASH